MSITTPRAKTNLSNQSLPELKKTAKALGISGTKDWTEDDFRKAIGARQRNRIVARVVDDMSKPIEPGYARIEIQHFGEDNAAPIPVNLNGSFNAIIPLNTVVDVPCEVVDSCLGNATTPSSAKRTGPDKMDYDVVKTSVAYPYREFGRNDSESVVPTVRTREAQSVREKYKAIFGRWPKSKEAREFQDLINRRKYEEIASGEMSEDTKAILQSKTSK